MAVILRRQAKVAQVLRFVLRLHQGAQDHHIDRTLPWGPVKSVQELLKLKAAPVLEGEAQRGYLLAKGLRLVRGGLFMDAEDAGQSLVAEVAGHGLIGEKHTLFDQALPRPVARRDTSVTLPALSNVK